MALGAKLKEAREKRKLTTSEVAAATRMKVQIVEDLEREDFSRIAAPVYGKGFIKLYAEFVGLKAKPLLDEYVVRFVDPPAPGSLGGEVTFQPAEPEAEEEESELRDDSPFALGNETTDGEPDLFSHAARKGDTPSPGQEGRLGGMIGRLMRSVRGLRSESRLDVVDGVEPEDDDEGLEVGEEYARYSAEDAGPTRYSASRIGLAAVGFLLIVLFVVSCLRRCNDSGGTGEGTPTPDGAPTTELEVALEPEEPYID